MSTTKHIPDNAAPRPENPILDRLAWTKMWVENDNTLWTVVGDTGSGKSYASMRIGEALDPGFTIDQVAFNIEEFLRLAMDDSYGQGTVIVLEEGSVEASAYDWHSVSNRVFAKLLDTWRHQNRMGIINLPNFKALEKGARRRSKAIVEMQHAAPWREYSQGKFKKVHYDNIEDKLRTPFPVIDGKQRKYVRFTFPSDDLVEAYEHRKENYTHQLNEELLEELLEVGEEGSGEEMSPQEIADQILEEGWREYVGDNNGQKYLDRGLIELDYDIGDRKGRKVKKAIQREIDEDIQ
jgi:hypothetical protein